jgi:chromate transport protein ChrA
LFRASCPPGGACFTNLSEAALLLLRLGRTAFGGPATLIARLRDGLVERWHWLMPAQLLGSAVVIQGITYQIVKIEIII